MLQASQFYLLNVVSVLFEEIPLLEPPTSPSMLAIARPPHLPAAPGGSPAPLPPAAARRAQTRSPNHGPLPRSPRAHCPSCSGSRHPAPQPCEGAKTLKSHFNPEHNPAPPITLKVDVFTPHKTTQRWAVGILSVHRSQYQRHNHFSPHQLMSFGVMCFLKNKQKDKPKQTHGQKHWDQECHGPSENWALAGCWATRGAAPHFLPERGFILLQGHPEQTGSWWLFPVYSEELPTCRTG